MEDCNSNTPTGESGQVGGGYAGAITRRTSHARDWAAATDPDARQDARNAAIDEHTLAAAHPEHRP